MPKKPKNLFKDAIHNWYKLKNTNHLITDLISKY